MLRIEEPDRALNAAPRGLALLALGFRPFYLLAALYAAIGVPAWVAMVEAGGAALPVLDGALWHSHEMIYGFALAVISGFLLTAVKAWTGRATPTGWALALLAAHWLAARVLLVTGPFALAAAVDAAYPFVLAAVLGRVLVAAGNRRNYFVVALLAGLGLADAVALHAAAAGDAGAALGWMKAALYFVLVLVLVMAGRVVPSFTGNALPRAKIARRPRLDRIALALSIAVFAADAAGASGAWLAAAALVAGALHAVRQAGWAPLATRGRPILWILHLSHAWFPVAFVLLAASALDWIVPAAALHAFGAGAIGGLVIAMITRTALGHTGRPLAAGRAELASYVLVHVAAAVRVAAALAPAFWLPLMRVSALAWSAAFLVYFAVYLPRLARPRIDGKPG